MIVESDIQIKDEVFGVWYKLVPKPSITPYESVLITMMLACILAGASDFYAYGYVVNHNLLHHFEKQE